MSTRRKQLGEHTVAFDRRPISSGARSGFVKSWMLGNATDGLHPKRGQFVRIEGTLAAEEGRLRYTSGPA